MEVRIIRAQSDKKIVTLGLSPNLLRMIFFGSFILEVSVFSDGILHVNLLGIRRGRFPALVARLANDGAVGHHVDLRIDPGEVSTMECSFGKCRRCGFKRFPVDA